VPRYDYQCVSCGHQFELVQSFSEAGSGTCPVCASDGRRLFHAVPVIYKGSGFYTTDYGRPKSPPPEKGEKAEKAEKKGTEPSKDTKSSDSKGAPSSASDSKGATTSAASESAT
jgi:putative FmdB family regulatory protein